MGMFDMMGMMGKVKEMQAKMQEVQEGLTKITAEGEAGAGMVRAVANGKKQLISIEIDHMMMKEDDREILQDLIVAAANAALRNAELLAADELKKSTEGLLPNIPGMDLNSMFGGK